MITNKSNIKVYTDAKNAFDKQQIMELFKQKYGKDINVPTIVPVASSPNQSVDEPSFISPLSDMYSIEKIYEKYLSENPNIDSLLFYEIDKEIEYKLPKTEPDKKSFAIKYINGVDILSFKEFSINLNMIKGLNFVHSIPENMGGKSNMFKLFQILLWGKFFKANEYSTYKDIFNRYSKTDTCFIEGMISISGEDYFIHRKFIKKGNSISQDFNFYKITEKNPDTAILFQDGQTYFLNIKNVKDDTDVIYAKNLYGKDANETQKVLKTLIGDVDEFIKVSMFDEFTFNNLLLSQNTERTRVFYNLFLGDVFENKLAIAKQLYKDFIEKNKLKNFDVNDVNNEIESFEKSIVDKTPMIDVLKQEIVSLEQKKDVINNNIRELNEKIQPLHYGIDTSMTTPQYLQTQLSQKQGIEQKLAELQNALSKLVAENTDNISVEQLNKKRDDYNADLNTLMSEKLTVTVSDEDKAKRDAIEQMVNFLKNDAIYKNSDPLNTFTDDEIKTFNELRTKEIQRNELLNTYKNISNELKNIQDNSNPDILCPHCGENISSISKSHESDLNKHLNEIKQNGVTLKNEITLLTDKIALYQKKYNNLLKDINTSIDNHIKSRNEYYTKAFEIIKEQIANVNAQLDRYAKIDKLKLDIDENKRKLDVVIETLTKLEKNKEIIRLNGEIKTKIDDEYKKLKEIDSQLMGVNRQLIEVQTEIKTLTQRIDENKKKLKQFESLLEKDRVFNFYITAHDKDGIVKYLIKQVIPIINTELSTLLADNDFEAYVEYEDEKYINYYFKRDGQISNLKGISGCERYIVLCALYLINIKFSRLNLSNIIVFDEVFGAVASVNLPLIYGILDEYRKLFPNVFIITHRNDFEIGDANIIEIEKQDNFSTIQI